MGPGWGGNSRPARRRPTHDHTARRKRHNAAQQDRAPPTLQARQPGCLPGLTGGQGFLGRPTAKTSTALVHLVCRPMGGGGRHIPKRNRCATVHGASSSLRGWAHKAGGRGGQTQSEYSESSPLTSGLARHCTPPRRPGTTAGNSRPGYPLPRTGDKRDKNQKKKIKKKSAY